MITKHFEHCSHQGADQRDWSLPAHRRGTLGGMDAATELTRTHLRRVLRWWAGKGPAASVQRRGHCTSRLVGCSIERHAQRSRRLIKHPRRIEQPIAAVIAIRHGNFHACSSTPIVVEPMDVAQPRDVVVVDVMPTPPLELAQESIAVRKPRHVHRAAAMERQRSRVVCNGVGTCIRLDLSINSSIQTCRQMSSRHPDMLRLRQPLRTLRTVTWGGIQPTAGLQHANRRALAQLRLQCSECASACQYFFRKAG